MNLLLVSKLADHTLSENVLLPLLQSSSINHIYVLRDFHGDYNSDKVTYLSPLKERKGRIRHLSKILKGISYCKKYKIDVILGVLIYPHGYIGRLISIFTNRPYIHMTIAGHREYWLKGRFIEKFNILFFGKSEMITVTGNQTRNYLLEKGICSQKLTILPNLPNSFYLESKIPMPIVREYDLVSFSRIDKNKNVSLLIRAIAKIKDDYEIKVAIAGDGSELKNVQEEVRKHNLSNNVVFLGYISELNEKIKIYTNSNIFVSCSKGEGFPVSMIEAMCCGCVPIVSNVGDIVDVLEQGKNGYVFNDTDNEDELAGYIKELLNNKNRIAKMRKEDLKITEKISIHKNGEIWDGIFSRLKKR